MLILPIRKELFWDVDYTSLDEKSNKRLIIERVLTLGNLAEFKSIELWYSKRTIKTTISKIGYLDSKTIEFVVSYYGLSKEKITCCKKKLLIPIHWD